MEKNLKALKRLRKLKKSNRALVLGHNALDYKSVLKYPFDYKTKRGLHPPAPTSLLFDNWHEFDGDIITCHFQNYNSRFVVATEHSPRFHASGGIKVSNVLAYNSESKEALDGMRAIGLDPNDFHYIDIPKVFGHNGNTIMLYSGLFALIFSCMMGYEEVYTAGLDGNIIGYEGGFEYKKKHIKAMKQFVRTGFHDKVGIFESDKPRNAAEWSDWKVVQNFEERMKYVVEYCRDIYPETKIYKSHELSLLPVDIRLPL